MATQYGINATLALTGGPVSMIPRAMQNGVVYGMFDMIETTADAAGEIYVMGGKLPKGAVVIGIFLSCDDLTADGATFDVGDAADDNRYIDNLDLTNARTGANVIIAPDSVTTQTTGMGYVIGTADTDDQIIITTATGATNGTLAITVLYLL